MGNAISPATGDILKTAAISKYMKLTKPQVLTIRDHLQAKQSVGRNHRGTIRREFWTQALQAALVRDNPDRDILELLFTMWDSNGTGRVACSELVVGISVLACRYDGVRDALRFALEVSDKHDTQMISSRDASALLRSICATTTYFGDQILHLRQIYKVVDNVFDTITLISQDADDLPYEVFTKMLFKQPLVAGAVATGPRRNKAVSFALSLHSDCSNSLTTEHSHDDNESKRRGRRHRRRPGRAPTPKPAKKADTTTVNSCCSSSTSTSSECEITLGGASSSHGSHSIEENSQGILLPLKMLQQTSNPKLSYVYSAVEFGSDRSESTVALQPLTRISIHTTSSTS